MKRKGGLGFLPEWLVGLGETAEEQFFRKLDLRGKVVFDVGAFHGLTALFFSQTARMVVAFEPNPLNCARAFQNILVNRLENVFLLNVAVDEKRGELPFVYEDNMAGRGSADQAIAARTVEGAPSARFITVPAIRLDEVVRAGFPMPDFIKIDVEGMEMRALRGAEEILRSRRPSLYVEIHGATTPDKERNVSRIVQFLECQGYTTLFHVESGAPITSGSASGAKEGHLYCDVGPA
ncbi:MAG TPA: FkbM family methyltransferase [Patescibacteria group bacterium]|nr:FkbM family methyltransferase [Patescibacteria group bacterium]